MLFPETSTTSPSHPSKPLEVPSRQATPPPPQPPRAPRVITHPQEVLHLVLQQMEAVTQKKDELTIALKGLTDLTKQLVRAYAAHTHTIAALQARLQALETPAEPSVQGVGQDGSPVLSQD